MTILCIPIVQKYTLKAGLFGRDINKRGTRRGNVRVPEGLGLASGVVFLVVFIFSQFFYLTDSEKLLEFNSSALSITLMLFLGFADDVLEFPWRYKLIFPAVSALPVLLSYHGSTYMTLPNFVEAIVGTHVVRLGVFYYVYMGLMTIFCTNSINIHAGINGLEAGQSFIIGIFVLYHNIVEYSTNIESYKQEQHLLSIFIIFPFIATTAGLLVYNWYPSKVFVGDTFTTFAGMTIAVAGILGHFSN
eukprot:UN29267